MDWIRLLCNWIKLGPNIETMHVKPVLSIFSAHNKKHCLDSTVGILIELILLLFYGCNSIKIPTVRSRQLLL